MDDVDDLFERRPSKSSEWMDGLGDNERAWFDTLIRRSRELGRKPVMKRAAADFERRFKRSVSPTTLGKYVDRALQ